jgi:hypothetical protein
VLGHIDAANQPEANRLGQLDDLERASVVKGLCHRAHSRSMPLGRRTAIIETEEYAQSDLTR